MRRLLIALAVVAGLIALVLVAAQMITEPLRRRMEATLNERLVGYRVALPGLALHPFSLSLSLLGLEIRQIAHPEPPVLAVNDVTAGVHWRALLALKLVADLGVESPRLHVDRSQLTTEAKDAVPIADKGWQAALESIYPLKFNQVRIHDGALTYIDDPRRPLRLTQVQVLTTDIRNVRSAAGTFPSPLHVSAVAFERGRLRVDGAADYLAAPSPNLRAEVGLAAIPLAAVAPVADDVNLELRGGELTAAGEIETVAGRQRAHLRTATIDGLTLDYVHRAATARAEAQRAERVADATAELAEDPSLRLQIDVLHLTNAALGYRDETTRPPYRVSFDDADVRILNVSNHSEQGRGWVTLNGRFMGSGPSELWASFVPQGGDPEVAAAIQIRDTDMRRMNQLFDAYGDFDVVGGRFSFFSELYIFARRIDGYIKPLFADVDVYDTRQDRGDPLPHKLYEGVVGGLAGLLENRDDRTATRAAVSGAADAPRLSVWEIALNLLRNAFFRTIVPGLEHAASGTTAATLIGDAP
ncbi:MAG: DUF748 domain-containing protein [Deltaproteobacteria bacterium]|nr:DUF748 domain-containing protein [Deltaproteobacteria bacterium]